MSQYAYKSQDPKDSNDPKCPKHGYNHSSLESLYPSDAISYMVTEIWVNTGTGNGLLPDGTKPLSDPLLTSH